MPLLGFGAVTLGREIGEDASYALLDHAFELGFRIFDTAEAYGGGNSRAYRLKSFGVDDVREASSVMHSSEIILGRWVRSRGISDKVRIHTKASGQHDASSIRNALTLSLERLQTEAVDGYYLHSPSLKLVEVLCALAEERQAGRIRHIGLCNAGLEILTMAHKTVRMDLCQNIYNLAVPDAGRELIPWCQAQGVRFVGYSPLGAGFLTGKYGMRGELSPKGTRFDVVPGHRDVYFRPECFAALERLASVAEATGLPASRLALHWALQRKDPAIVLVGATCPKHLDNAVAALKSPIDESILANLEFVGVV